VALELEVLELVPTEELVLDTAPELPALLTADPLVVELAPL
jgi:hypothetical protein